MSESTDDLVNEFLLKGGKIEKIKRRSPRLTSRDWDRLNKAPPAEREKVRREIEQEKTMARALRLKKFSKKMKG